MHVFFWRDSCQNQRQKRSNNILTGVSSLTGMLIFSWWVSQNEKKRAGDNWLFYILHMLRLDCNQYPVSRKILLFAVYIDFLIGTFLRVAASQVRGYLFRSSQQIFVVLWLCAKSYAGLTG